MGLDGLIKIYIENLNLPAKKKKELLESNPKTLTEVSLWLKKHTEKTNEPTTTFLTEKTKNKNEIAKEIQLFSNNELSYCSSMSNSPIIDADDSSWGLSIERTQSTSPTNKTQSASKTQNTNNSTKPDTAPKTESNQITAEDKRIEAQNVAIENIKSNINNAIETIMQQYENEGVVSQFYNTLKEYFNAELGKSNICRCLYAEQKTVELLERAQNNDLTKEEYFNQKFDIAIDLLTANSDISEEDKEYLKEYLLELTPEELDNLISKLKNTPDNLLKNLDNHAQKLIEKGKDIKQKRLEVQNTDSKTKYIDNPNSIRSFLNSNKAKELMTFEEVYKAERGVEFSQENIDNYEEKLSKFVMANTLVQKSEDLHNNLGEKLKFAKSLSANGASEQERKNAEKQLKDELISTLIKLYGNDEEKISKALSELADIDIEFKDGNLVQNEKYQYPESELIQLISENLIKNTDENTNKFLNGRILEDFKTDMAYAYREAYGRKNASELANAFKMDQEAGVLKIRNGVEIAGAGIMIAGMFIATPVALAGAAISSFGGIGVEALNEATRKEGMSDDVKKELAAEVLQNIGLLTAGGAAGKAGNIAKATLLAKKCPTLVACISDIGVDATISLIGDLVLTGEIDITGEGLSQLLSLIAGHVRTHKFGKGKLSLQDISPSKNPAFNHALEDLKKTNPKLYDDYMLLRNKNILPSNFGNIFINAKDSKLNPNLLKDIEVMADCVRKGIDPKDAFIPKMKNLDAAAKTKSMGEVFSLEGTNDVYIMSDSGPVKLDMDRDTYYNLFPPIQSHVTTQGSIGDCYFVSSILDATMNNPAAKVEFMKMIHQKGDDIIINFKEYQDINANTNKDYITVKSDQSIYDNCPSQIVFKNAKNRLSSLSGAKISGAQGLKLMEEAYGYKIAATEISECMKQLNIPENKQKEIFAELQKVFEDDNYKPSKDFIDILQKTFNGKEFDFLTHKVYSNDEVNIKSKIFKSINDMEDLRKKAFGNGGYPDSTLHNFFGLSKYATETFSNTANEEQLIKFLNQYENNPNIIFTASTYENNKFIDSLNILFGITSKGQHTIIGPHAYRIDSFDIDKRTVNIVNPWDTSKIVTISFEEFGKYFVSIKATDITKTTEKEISKLLSNKMEQFGVKTTSPNGRKYSNAELLKKFLDKLKFEKNIESPYYREIGCDDILIEEVYKNKCVIDLIKKLNIGEKLAYSELDNITKSICQIGENGINDPQRVQKLVKNIDKLLDSTDIDFDVAYKLVSTMHTDYEFMIEHALDMYKSLKAKGYEDNLILEIIRNTGKENYNEMKMLWE